MTIRTVYHATDGTQWPSRAAAQRYERAREFLDWLEANRGKAYAFPLNLEEAQSLAQTIAERWYLLDRQAPRKRAAPAFTGNICMTCGGRLEAIAGIETCVTCQTEVATRLRKQETSDVG